MFSVFFTARWSLTDINCERTSPPLAVRALRALDRCSAMLRGVRISETLRVVINLLPRRTIE